MRYALVEVTSGLVINMVEIDSNSRWYPPEGTKLILSNTAEIGDVWDGVEFTKGNL